MRIFLFTLAILFSIPLAAQTITGSWYGKADILLSGHHSNYLTELIIKQKGDDIEGIFGYYFKNGYQSFFVRGKYDKKKRVLEINDLPITYFRESSIDGVNCYMDLVGTMIASQVKTTMNGGANLSGPSQPILTIGISKTSDQVVYASTVPRYAVRSRIFRTTNGGTSFTEITGTLPDRFYSKIAVDPTNHSRIAITLSGFGSSHVFLSTNSGTNWTDIGTGLPDVPANTLAFDPDNVGVLYVGTDNGVYYAQNVPLSTSATSLTIPWSSYNEGFPDGVMVSDFVFTPKPPLPAQRKIRLATFGRGLWERDLAPYIALPFNTISLEAKRVNQLNEINWKINGEHNVSYYEVEYSANGRDFTSISKLNARNTGEQQSYSYIHNISNNANSYYRIKIVDIDGAVKFSSTELISAENNIPVFKVYPNPTSSSIHVSFTATADQQARYIIYNTAGSRMAVKSLSLMKGAQDISIDVSGFASGSYRIVLEYNGTKKSTTIIKK